jgi:hypothetical protein
MSKKVLPKVQVNLGASPLQMRPPEKPKAKRKAAPAQRVTLVIPAELRRLVNGLVDDVRENGAKKDALFTANTVYRTFIGLLRDFKGDISQVTNEEELVNVVKTFFRIQNS